MTTAPSTLDREFLVIRAKILEIAAALDRIDRTDGSAEGDERLQQIAKAIQVLSGNQEDRAAAVQMIFSLPYNSEWRSEFGI